MTETDAVILDYQACVALRECVSTEVSRPGLNSVRIADGYAEATNGHIMVRVPCETGGLDVLVEAHAFKLVKVRQSLEVCANRVRVLDKDMAPLVEVGQPFDRGSTYPNTRQVREGLKTATHRVSFDGRYLAKIAKMADKNTGRVDFALTFAKSENGDLPTCITGAEVSFNPDVSLDVILMPLRVLGR